MERSYQRQREKTKWRKENQYATKGIPKLQTLPKGRDVEISQVRHHYIYTCLWPVELALKSTLNLLPYISFSFKKSRAFCALSMSMKSAWAKPLGCPVLRSMATLTSITLRTSRKRSLRSLSDISNDMLPMNRVLDGSLGWRGLERLTGSRRRWN
jgi:hypothetical protein